MLAEEDGGDETISVYAMKHEKHVGDVVNERDAGDATKERSVINEANARWRRYSRMC